jgi:hypothetical protein
MKEEEILAWVSANKRAELTVIDANSSTLANI